MISKEQIAAIRRLYYAEHWKIGTIATELGLHADTVKRAVGTERFKSRVSKRLVTDPFLDFIQQTLKQYPRLRATRLFEMVKARGYKGGDSQLRRVVRQLCPVSREAFLRLSPFPAEQAQADWASFGEVSIGRARRRLSCFVLTLSYSRAIWLEFFLDQSLENFLLGHVNAFHDWGGVCRTILYDNLKSAVLERLGDQVRLHPRLLDLCGHYHFAARPCNPGRGNEKGRLEFRPSPAAPQDLAGKIGKCLTDWTGERWLVVISNDKGAATLREDNRSQEKKLYAEIANDPNVARVLEAFPGAEIVSVRERQQENLKAGESK